MPRDSGPMAGSAWRRVAAAREGPRPSPLPPPPRGGGISASGGFALTPPPPSSQVDLASLAVLQPLPAPPGVGLNEKRASAIEPLPPPPKSGSDAPSATGRPSPSTKRTRRGISSKQGARRGRAAERSEVIVIDDDDDDDHDDDIIEVSPSSAPSDPRRYRASSARVVPSPVAVSSSKAGGNDSGRKRGREEASANAAFARGAGTLYTSQSSSIHPTTTVEMRKEPLRRAAPGPSLLGALLDRRRLPLVLDLDHTLLNSATFDDCEDEAESLQTRERAERADPDERSLYRMDHIGMWTKLRPGVRCFLRQAASMFEIHVLTAGSQAYAGQMLRLLDPKKELVKGSVIGLARYDEYGVMLPGVIKRLDKGLKGTEPAAIILDDTAGVWPGHADNLIECERYVFFPACRKKFGMPSGASLFEQNSDEDAASGMLSTVLEVLRRVHAEFFARRAAQQALSAKRARQAAEAAKDVALDDDDNTDDTEGAGNIVDDGDSDDAVEMDAKKRRSRAHAEGTKSLTTRMNEGDGGVSRSGLPITVPELLALEKRRVLAGTELVFSCVFQEGTPPHEHELWRIATSFGARCVTEQGPDTTHVVVAPENLDGPGGTSKMQWAAAHGKHVVTPQWLKRSATMFCRADEKKFPVCRR